MYKHPIRKFTGLLVLYSIIIIGIFVLQFRSESTILLKAGLLKISLEQNIDDRGNATLLNSVKASFKGVTFEADERTPLLLSSAGSPDRELSLVSWEQVDSTHYKFNYTDSTSLIFSVTDTSSTASLSIDARLPRDASSLSLSYKPDSSFTVTRKSDTLSTFESGSSSYRMTSPASSGGRIIFTAGNQSLAYSYQEPPKPVREQAVQKKTFTFAQLPKNAQSASEQAFLLNSGSFRSNLLTQAQTVVSTGTNLTEQIAAAYIAEMASRNRYTEAVNTVSEEYRKGSSRTYFTAPYFNSLVSMNSSLVKENDALSMAIRSAIAQNSLDIFASQHLAQFMLRNPGSENVIALAKLPANLEKFEPSLAQASDIIAVYAYLKAANSSLAAYFDGVTAKCIEKITSCAALMGETLVLREGETPVTFAQTIRTASALIDYGKSVSDEKCTAAGYMLANTAFSQTPVTSLAVSAALYPYIAKQNRFYPHYAIAGKSGTETVWAWTCAPEIRYTENDDGSETDIFVDFGLGDSHYIILKGIKPFSDIKIYGIPFHTDQRFETYNSSGYVYNENTHTLYLKSRHKSEQEVIHLTFRRKEAEPAQPAVQPSPAPAETPAPSQQAAPANTEYADIPESDDAESDDED